MADQQTAATPMQGGVQFEQRLANEVDAPIVTPGQRIENFAFEEKRAMDAPSPAQRFAQRHVIAVTQIAPEPDQN